MPRYCRVKADGIASEGGLHSAYWSSCEFIGGILGWDLGSEDDDSWLGLFLHVASVVLDPNSCWFQMFVVFVAAGLAFFIGAYMRRNTILNLLRQKEEWVDKEKMLLNQLWAALEEKLESKSMLQEARVSLDKVKAQVAEDKLDKMLKEEEEIKRKEELEIKQQKELELQTKLKQLVNRENEIKEEIIRNRRGMLEENDDGCECELNILKESTKHLTSDENNLRLNAEFITSPEEKTKNVHEAVEKGEKTSPIILDDEDKNNCEEENESLEVKKSHSLIIHVRRRSTSESRNSLNSNKSICPSYSLKEDESEVVDDGMKADSNGNTTATDVNGTNLSTTDDDSPSKSADIIKTEKSSIKSYGSDIPALDIDSSSRRRIKANDVIPNENINVESDDGDYEATKEQKKSVFKNDNTSSRSNSASSRQNENVAIYEYNKNL